MEKALWLADLCIGGNRLLPIYLYTLRLVGSPVYIRFLPRVVIFHWMYPYRRYSHSPICPHVHIHVHLTAQSHANVDPVCAVYYCVTPPGLIYEEFWVYYSPEGFGMSTFIVCSPDHLGLTTLNETRMNFTGVNILYWMNFCAGHASFERKSAKTVEFSSRLIFQVPVVVQKTTSYMCTTREPAWGIPMWEVDRI